MPHFKGCPRPGNQTLVQRLLRLRGCTVTVYSPGFPRLTRTVGRLCRVTANGFVVGSTHFFYNTSFYIVLGTPARQRLPYEVVATAEELGSLTGRLVRVGRDFVELIQIPGRPVSTLFPLNMFTEVTCSGEAEE